MLESARVRKVERRELVADVSKLRRERRWQPRVDLTQGIRELLVPGT